MPSVVRWSLLVVCAVCCMPVVAAGQYRSPRPAGAFGRADSTPLRFLASGDVIIESSGIDLLPPGAPYSGPVPAGGGAGYYPGYRPGPSPVTRLKRTRPPQEPQWVIPVGEYGLELSNGMRIVGRPSKDWTARITTAFGVVVIPLTQIAHIAPAGNGQFSAFLRNGDRVTGSLGSNTMTFETKFGTLSVAATDITRLRSSTAVAAPQPVAGTTPRSGPPGVGAAGGPVRLDSPPLIPRADRRLIERLEKRRSK